jgi:UDP-glucose:(heptosyl)LPS alpha-1,3-glucosyltransferase
MKIGLVIDRFDPRRGGAQQWTYQHAERLIARGHEVHVVAGEASPAAVRLGVVVHEVGFIQSHLPRAQAAENMLRSLQLDVVHDIGLGWHNDILQSEDGSRLAQWERLLLLLPSWQRPLKRTLIGLLPRYREFRRLMARQFGDRQRIVLAVSKMCARDYQRHHGVRPEQIRLVYHGADNERFSPAHRAQYRLPVRRQLGIPEEAVVFLFVGHDYRRKGLATAVRAVCRLADEGRPAHLLVVGGNRRAQRSRWLFGPRHRAVTLAGAVDDPVPYYAASDAFVLPTFYDPSSLSVAEAASSGLPCVTTRFNGAAELLTEGLDGFVLFDPSDYAALADRLRRLTDPATRQAMGLAARRLAERYTLDRNCEEILAVYHEVLRWRSGRREAA